MRGISVNWLHLVVTSTAAGVICDVRDTVVK